MQASQSRSPHSISRLIVCLLTFCAIVWAQKTAPTKPTEPDDDVIRINTDLVQTDVTVVDKHGRVVAGLKPEAFDLRIDSKSQPLTFFEEVIAGSSEEEKQLKAARQGKTLSPATPAKNVDPDRGQLIFFFVDDVHLTGDGWARARSLLLNFLDHRMKPNDRVAIISASGQIGFLQQLTDNKAVLREAISRLNPKYNPETTASQVNISEVDANMVANHSDRGLLNYLVIATMREYQMQNPINAVTMVTNRVRQINQQGKMAEYATLSGLENLIRSTGPLPGRKVVFLVSDGFVADIKRSNGAEAIARIGKQAANAGAVIYALDTRAAFFGAGSDVSRNDYPDYSGGTAWRSIVESKAPQEPLETLADETGGRAYLNANALDEGLAEALGENSTYYLLGWRPETELQRGGRSRIQVTVKDRPDLKVRTRKHYFDSRTLTTSRSQNSATASPEDELKFALGSLYPRRDLPTFVSAVINPATDGAVLNISMKIDSRALTFDGSSGKETAIVDVLGVAVDDRGVCSTFRQKLDIPREALTADPYVKWGQSLTLPSGLYQVRVAVRDRKSGITGSAMMWIEAPRR
jgi:VWFA-related protein